MVISRVVLLLQLKSLQTRWRNRQETNALEAKTRALEDERRSLMETVSNEKITLERAKVKETSFGYLKNFEMDVNYELFNTIYYVCIYIHGYCIF